MVTFNIFKIMVRGCYFWSLFCYSNYGKPTNMLINIFAADIFFQEIYLIPTIDLGMSLKWTPPCITDTQEFQVTVFSPKVPQRTIIWSNSSLISISMNTLMRNAHITVSWWLYSNTFIIGKYQKYRNIFAKIYVIILP